MGLLGPSRSELSDRIDELETEVERAKDNADQANKRADRAHKRVHKAEKRATEQAETAARIAHALNELHTADVGELQDKRGTVEQLDEPAIVWKTTRDYIVKLLIPEGATVVHPDNHHHRGLRKKRTDEAVVLAFYEVEKDQKKVLQANGGSIAVGTSSASTQTISIGHDYRTEKSVADQPACENKDHSRHDGSFEYRIGETVEPATDLDRDVSTECTEGIHFFCTQDEALDWYTE